MRDQLHLMEVVDNYLDGTMNTDDRSAFEARLQNNTDLQNLVDDQRRLRRAAGRSPVRAAAKKAYSNYKLSKWLPGIGGAVVVVLLAVGGWVLMNDGIGFGLNAEQDGLNEQAELIPLPYTAGVDLPAVLFTIDPKTDTTLITPNGLVVDIPRGAFLDKEGRAVTTPVRVTLLEAIDGVDILKAGLSTMSGDTLLETGGMFYLDAQVNGQRVGIDPAKPLTVMVPSDRTDPGMMLYEGVKTENGIVDWRNPKPLARTLVPVDITTLDFYPPRYLSKVTELGQDATDKRYTDSLYWSFSGALTRHQLFGPAEYNTITINHIAGDTAYSLSDFSSSQSHFNTDSSTPTEQGAYLFARSCASCHSPTRDMTGPALAGSRERWKGRGDIHAWVKNSIAVIKSGNAYANRLFNHWNKSVMTPNDLSDREIDLILDYADSQGFAEGGPLGIDPAKVKTIWSERFNNTNLATREFEERMIEIHRTCDNSVLDLYANNLDKNLSHLDSMAVRMGHGAFASFALHNDGRVALPAHAAERLKQFYFTRSRIEAEAIHKVTEKYLSEQREQDMQAGRKRDEHTLAESIREGQLFEREFEANLDTVYKQLGYQRARSTGSAWVVPVTNPGWWNVDKAVLESTTARTSMSYTDDKTGKTATLTYTPITIEVADRSTFSELRVYLIPQELNSYQRVTEINGAFTERLNANFQYDLMCMGRRDGQLYAASQWNISASTSIRMEPTDEESLRRMVRTRQVSMSTVNDLVEQARHLQWLELEAERQETKRKKEELRIALLPVIFPCSVTGSDSLSQN